MTMWFCKRFLATGAKGFTIIELLVALGVLAIVIGISAQVFLSISGGFIKSTTIAALQEEGSRVMNEMSRTIRGGKKVEDAGPSPGGTGDCGTGAGIKVTLLKDSLEYAGNGNCEEVFFCEVPTDGSTYNSYLTKSLGNCVGAPLGGGELTSKDPQTGVHISGLTFTVTGGASSPYRVDITLNLQQGISAPANQTSRASLELKNSISTRNF